MRTTRIPERFLADRTTMSLLKHPFSHLSERQRLLLEDYSEDDSVKKFHMMSIICSDLMSNRKYRQSMNI